MVLRREQHDLQRNCPALSHRPWYPRHMPRSLWQLLAWLLFLSVVFWAPLVFRSRSSGPPRPAELESRP
jgi:hypothetical protein